MENALLILGVGLRARSYSKVGSHLLIFLEKKSVLRRYIF